MHCVHWLESPPLINNAGENRESKYLFPLPRAANAITGSGERKANAAKRAARQTPRWRCVCVCGRGGEWGKGKVGVVMDGPRSLRV